jgi:hypothetical protein
MDPATIAAAIAGLFGLFHGSGSSNTQSALPPQLQQQMADLMGYQTRRLGRVEPIHQAAMAMATRLAPAYARNAMTASPTSSGGGTTPVAQALAALMNGGGINYNSAGNSLFTPQGVTYMGDLGYRIPGASATPVTGPEDPNPYHHPTGPDIGSPISDEMRRLFFGNPFGAFFGGGMPGSGQQENGGGREPAY